MPYLNAVIDWIESEGFIFECGEDVNDAFQDIEDEWQPNNRFTIPQLITTDMPSLMLYLQEQIDNECEDTTETITFPPERIERDETREDEILKTEIELLEAKRDLLQLQIKELERPERSIIDRVTSFIRNIFGG